MEFKSKTTQGGSEKSSGKAKEKVKKEALDLCLKYGFVTTLTSMVVTKPQGEDSQDTLRQWEEEEVWEVE
ncbi:unnamed protein product [Coregonus sp. 'balchen']|nr:unnamed protein product [Coregonus sp. 'balchen']